MGDRDVAAYPARVSLDGDRWRCRVFVVDELPAVVLEVERAERTADEWQLVLYSRGEWLAPATRIEDGHPVEAGGWAIPGAGLLTLLQGERRTVAVRLRGVPPAERRLRVPGWNVEEQLVG